MRDFQFGFEYLSHSKGFYTASAKSGQAAIKQVCPSDDAGALVTSW